MKIIDLRIHEVAASHRGNWFFVGSDTDAGTDTDAATDPDGDPLSFSIVTNADPDADGTEAFRVEGNQLLVNDPGDLDYETDPQLVITIEAGDGSLSDTAQVTVNLSDLPEASISGSKWHDSDGDGSCDSDDLCTGNDTTGDTDRAVS